MTEKQDETTNMEQSKLVPSDATVAAAMTELSKLVEKAVGLLALTDARNYVEFHTQRPEDGRHIRCLFELGGGKSPAQVTAEHDLEIERLKQQLGRFGLLCKKVRRARTLAEAVLLVDEAQGDDG